MKITVTHEWLVSKLFDQRLRVVAKQEAAQECIAAHTRSHEAEASRSASERVAGGADPAAYTAKGRPVHCPVILMARGLLLGIDTHLRRLDAAMEVLQQTPSVSVTLPMSKYLSSYVCSPFDGVMLPDPEEDEYAPTAMGHPLKLPN